MYVGNMPDAQHFAHLRTNYCTVVETFLQLGSFNSATTTTTTLFDEKNREDQNM